MKLTPIVLTLILLFAMACLGIAQTEIAAPGRGIDEVEVVKTTATVEKIDLEKRKVTLTLEDGKKKTYKVDPSVQNLDRVAVGEHLNIAYTEELVVTVTKSSDSPAAASLGAMSIAPKGAKPGAVMVETTALSGKVLAVEPEKHKVTFLDPDGKKKTVKVSKTVNINQLKPGEMVNAVLTESLVVDVTK
jgi:Cu/Ag efflux protein CusF